MWEVYWHTPYGTVEYVDADTDYDRLTGKYHGKMFEIVEVY